MDFGSEKAPPGMTQRGACREGNVSIYAVLPFRYMATRGLGGFLERGFCGAG